MIFLAWASSVFSADGPQIPGSRARRSRGAVAVGRLADTLFYRPAGVAGTLGRLGLLVIVAVISYHVGAGVGAVIVKAPVPAALFIGAVLLSWATSDPDRD